MNKFITIIRNFVDKKISFKDFDSQWQEIYLNSGEYDLLSEKDTNFLDEIHDKEDYVTEDEDELRDLKKYNFISSEEFRDWLVVYLTENKIPLENFVDKKRKL